MGDMTEDIHRKGEQDKHEYETSLRKLKSACEKFVNNIDVWILTYNNGMIKTALHDIQQKMNEI